MLMLQIAGGIILAVLVPRLLPIFLLLGAFFIVTVVAMAFVAASIILLWLVTPTALHPLLILGGIVPAVAWLILSPILRRHDEARRIAEERRLSEYWNQHRLDDNKPLRPFPGEDEPMIPTDERREPYLITHASSSERR